MFTWLFKYYKQRSLRAQSHLPFASHRATKETISSQIMEMLERAQPAFLYIVSKVKSLKQQVAFKNSLVHHKDEFGIVKELEQPLFPPAYVARLRRTKLTNWICILVFAITEGFLFYLVSNQMLGAISDLFSTGRTRNNDNSLATYISFGFSFAMAFMAALGIDKGLEKIYAYFRAKYHFQNMKLDEAEYKKARLSYIKGLILLIFSSLFSLGIGLSRIFSLHSGSGSLGSIFLSIALLVLTIVSGIYMGMGKSDADEASDMLYLHRKWKNISKTINTAKADLLKRIEAIRHQFAILNEKSYQLTLDLQTIYQQEVDARDEDLHKEYKSELYNNTHKPNDAGYEKYKSLHTNERMLHDYGFTSHERIMAMMKKLNDYESYILSIDDNLSEKDNQEQLAKIQAASNGHSKDNSIIEDAEIVEPSLNEFSNQ